MDGVENKAMLLVLVITVTLGEALQIQIFRSTCSYITGYERIDSSDPL